MGVDVHEGVALTPLSKLMAWARGRSLWPMMTMAHPASANCAADISPV